MFERVRKLAAVVICSHLAVFGGSTNEGLKVGLRNFEERFGPSISTLLTSGAEEPTVLLLTW
jgi:hypothetical protein